MDKDAIFPLFYLPPVQFFNKFIQYQSGIYLDKFEHFPKQTYRNRAVIYSPNGKLNLVVPVVKGSKVHTRMMDVKISYDFDWQRLHWMSLQTAYRRSAYFEYYEDEFAIFFEKKWDFLFDYTEEILIKLLYLLRIKQNYQYTDEYVRNYSDRDDYRDIIHPKQTTGYTVKPYFQLFEDRNGFINNLSIVDLLFNQGPQSVQYLK